VRNLLYAPLDDYPSEPNQTPVRSPPVPPATRHEHAEIPLLSLARYPPGIIRSLPGLYEYDYPPDSHSSMPSHLQPFLSNFPPSHPIHATQSPPSVSYQPASSLSFQPRPLCSSRGAAVPPAGPSRCYRPLKAPTFPDFIRQNLANSTGQPTRSRCN